MKRILILLFLMPSLMYGQQELQFNGKFNIGGVSAGVTGDYTLHAYYISLTNSYTVDSLAIGNEIFDNKCDRFEVVAITQIRPYVIIEVDSLTGNQPSTGNGLIYEPTEQYKYPLITSGLSRSLLACIETYRAILIDEDVASGSGYWSKKDSIVYYDNDVAIGLDTANLSLGLLSKGLHINGQKYAELKLTNQTSGTTTTDGASIYTDSNNDIVLKNNESNGEIRFQTGGSTRMRIDQGGDVGIGVNTPAEKLHVVGNTILAGEVRLDSFANTRDDLVSPVNFLSTDLNGNLQSLPIDSIPSGGSSLWSENGTEIYYNTNNVGIGTTDPVSDLHIEGTDELSRYVSNNDNGRIHYYLGGTMQSRYQWAATETSFKSYPTGANLLFATGANSDIVFRTGAADNSANNRMTITGSGSVGIGIDAPETDFHIKGTDQLVIIESTNDNGRIDYSINGDIKSRYTWTATESSFKSYPTGSNILFATGANGDVVFRTGGVDNSANDRMTITGSGNVGIGLSDPDEDLEVNGNIKLSSSLPYIRFNGNNTAAVFDIKHNNSTKLEFYYNGNRMSYYRPIGTTGQFAFKQYSTGATADNYPGFSFDGDEDTGMGLYGADQLFLTTGGETRLLANNTGVGIGTTNPIYMLHVASGWIANTTEGIRVKNGDNLTPTFGFVDDGDLGIYRVTTNTLGFAGGAGTNMEISTTDIKLNDYPNTRDDLVSPVNFLSTDASGNILSMPIDSLNIGSGGGDNLGDHTATTTLTMGTNRINRSGDGVLDGLGFSSQDEVEIYNNLGTVEVLFDIPNTTGAQIEVEQAAFGTDQEGVPAYSFSGDDDTGMFREATNELGFSTFGSRRMLLKQDSIYLDDFPNTRDDNVTAVNFLSTNANGRLQSLPITDLSGGIYGGSGSIPSDITVTGGAFDLDFDALADARFQSMTGQFHVGTSQNSSIAISLNTTSSGGDIDLDSADDIRLEAADDINIISETSSVNIEAANLINIGANTDTNTIDIGDDEDDIIRLGGVDLTDYDADLPNFLGITSTSGTIGLINHEEVPPSVGGVTTAGGFSAANRTFVNTINSGTPSTALPSAGSYQKDGDILTYCNKSASTDHDVTGHIEDTASNTVTVSPGDCVRFFWDETNDTWWIL